MSSSQFVLCVPDTPHPLALPWFSHPPPPTGRKQPNGKIIVIDENNPDFLYKFIPWEKATLSWNEINTYAKLAARHKPDGIVALLGISGTATHLVEKMERSHQGALDRFLFETTKNEAEKITPETIRILLLQIAQAMCDLRALGLVHRDLKAENILVFAQHPNAAWPHNLRVKVADFDRAITLAHGETLKEPVGSLFHMAPELLLWEDFDHKIDLYAFGILMFEVAHGGATPYTNVGNGMPGSLSRTEFVQKVVHEHFRPVWQHADTILRDLAARCWASNPAERPEFSEICDILRASLHPSSAAHARIYPHEAREKPSSHIGIASHIGKQRSKMEDAACVLQTDTEIIAGVFDGLRGSYASEQLAKRLVLLIAHTLQTHTGNAEAALYDAFSTLETELKSITPPMDCGSTATVALLQQDALFIAWLGDSSARLFRKSNDEAKFCAIDLTTPHHPDREDEAQRIMNNGGSVEREKRWLDNGDTIPVGPARVFVSAAGNRGIALSRAFGLFSFKPAISSEPEIARMTRQHDDAFLVLGTDGVFDFLDAHIMYQHIKRANTMHDAAQALIDAVLQIGAPDNATAIVIDLENIWRQQPSP